MQVLSAILIVCSKGSWDDPWAFSILLLSRKRLWKTRRLYSLTAERVWVQIPSDRHGTKQALTDTLRGGAAANPATSRRDGGAPLDREKQRNAKPEDRGEPQVPKRSEKRDAAKAEYLARKTRGEQVDLRQLAESMGVNYQTMRNWKTADQWEKALPKKKRGAQPGNRNSAGHKNAAGSHKGASAGNKNAEKDGAYSAIFFDMLTDAERELAEKTPLGSRAALEHEMQLLKLREYKIISKITEYENAPEDELYLTSVVDMREPAGRGESKKDGARQQMGMYNKDSAFARTMKLQEALYKVQGRIAKIADSLRALEENERRLELEKERLEILKMRATGMVDVPDPAGGEEHWEEEMK